MLHVPTCFEALPGFQVTVTPVEENLVQSGCGDEYFEDWYIQIMVHCNGTHWWLTEDRSWEFRVARLCSPTMPEIMNSPNFSLVVLEPEEIPTQFQVCEDSIEGYGYGIWALVKFTLAQEKANFSHTFRLASPKLSS